MPLISYSQNFEDVMLARALRDVECGLYVDVGPADPEANSVTRAFYERGWSGINVEPLDENFLKLTISRPRDINLKVDMTEEAGERTSCFLALEKTLERNGWPTIHFFRIDFTGAEAAVLAALNSARVRPWIIVVKAVTRDSALSTRANWEHVVVQRGYTFAYFDGLNCFYVADEFPELAKRLAVPPNVFDDFVTASDRANRLQIAHLHSALQTEQTKTIHLLGRVRQLEADLAALRQRRGLQGLLRQAREVFDRATGGGVRKLASRMSMRAIGRFSDLTRRSRITEHTRRTFRSFPRIHSILLRLGEKSRAAIHTNSGAAPGSLSSTDAATAIALPASARPIYRRLKTAVSESMAENRIE